jgi:hypothetical protein
MQKPLLPLTIPPGLYRNGTVYESKGRYYDADLIRFYQSTVRPIGGWRSPNGGPAGALTGKPRTMYTYRTNSGGSRVAVGTTSKLYSISSGASHDITPSGLTTLKVDGAYSSGGAYGKGAYGAGKYGTGSITPVIVNPDTWSLDNFGQDLLAVSTSDKHIYLWDNDNSHLAAKVPLSEVVYTGTPATVGVTALGASLITIDSTTLTGTIRVGERFTISGVEYTVITADVVASGNALTNIAIQPATPASIPDDTTVTGFDEQPPLATCAFVTPEFIVMALLGKTATWSDQAEISIWSALESNQAGDYDLATRGTLMAGSRAKSQSLLWTDCDLWTASYTGDQFVYRFEQAGDNCGLMGPRAFIVSDGRAMWMSSNFQFFRYDGYVQPIPCEVADAVFTNFNLLNAYKTYAVHFPQYGEIWWHYCSATATECDSVVVYNYNENHWNLHHSIQRNVGMAAGATTYMWMADSSGYLYEHEVPGLTSRGSFKPYLESGPIELGSGDLVMVCDGVVPDDKTLGDVSLSLYTSFYPDDVETLNGPFTLASPTYFDEGPIRARQARVRFDEVTQDDWRVGLVRLSAKEGSRR